MPFPFPELHNYNFKDLDSRRDVFIRALNGVGAGFLEWGMTSPSEAVFECLLVFNQSGDGLESFSGACRSRKCLG